MALLIVVCDRSFEVVVVWKSWVKTMNCEVQSEIVGCVVNQKALYLMFLRVKDWSIW